jgi:sugar lactone lactonase YvrE
MALFSGCGGGSTAAVTGLLPAKVPLTDSDVTGKTFYVTPIDATALGGYGAYKFVADKSAKLSKAPVKNPVDPATTLDSDGDDGSWSVDTTTGVLTLTDTTASKTFAFTCIQKERNYLLVYDTKNSNKISRLYFNAPDDAPTFALDLIQAYQSLISSSVAGDVKLGGAVQGTPLPVFKNITTIAGSGGTKGFTDGQRASATFSQPNGIATDGTNLYVADFNNNMIRKIDIATETVTRLAGSTTGLAGSANTVNDGDNATFNLPADVTTDGKFLYVADSGNHTIRKIDKDTGAVSLLAGIAGSSGSADSTDGSGTTARFNQPTGITTDGTNLYVADFGNHTVRKVVISSGAVVTLAGAAGSAGSTDSTDGTGTSARLNTPGRITTDGTYLYVTEFKNATIRKILIATGAVTTIAGSPGVLGSTDATGSAARFNQPNGITTDGTNLYVVDNFNGLIRKLSPTNGVYSVTTLQLDGHFNKPVGITTDGTNLFVTDNQNQTIRKIE